MSYLAFWPTFRTDGVLQHRLEPRDDLVQRDLGEVGGRLECQARRRRSGRPGCSRPRPARRPGKRRTGRRWPTTGRRSRCRRRRSPPRSPARSRRRGSPDRARRHRPRCRSAASPRSPAGLGRAPAPSGRRPRPRVGPGCGTPWCSRNSARTVGSGAATSSSSSGSGRGVSQSSFTSSRERRIWSAKSIRVSRRFCCLISPARARRRLEVAVLVDQGRGGLDADTGRAGDVVHRIAAQGLDVDHLLRRHAELLDHLGDGRCGRSSWCRASRPDRRPAASGPCRRRRSPPRRPGRARGRHRRRSGRRPRSPGSSRQGTPKARVASRTRGNCGTRSSRRRRPVRLVVGVELVAERLLRMVEDHRQVGRRVGRRLHVHQQLPQHVAEALHRAHRQAVGLAGQRRQGVDRRGR